MPRNRSAQPRCGARRDVVRPADIQEQGLLHSPATAERYDRIVIEQRLPFFQFRVGPYHMASYCAGHTAEADARASFPGNRTRLASSLTRTRISCGYSRMMSSTTTQTATYCLNDIGNAEQGLRCSSSASLSNRTREKIKKWGTIHDSGLRRRARDRSSHCQPHPSRT